MKRYEYIQMRLDWGDLDQLNRLSLAGFRVVVNSPCPDGAEMLLLERDITEVGERALAGEEQKK